MQISEEEIDSAIEELVTETGEVDYRKRRLEIINDILVVYKKANLEDYAVYGYDMGDKNQLNWPTQHVLTRIFKNRRGGSFSGKSKKYKKSKKKHHKKSKKYYKKSKKSRIKRFPHKKSRNKRR